MVPTSHLRGMLAACAAAAILAVEGACQGQSAAAPALSQPGTLTAKFDTREIKTAAEPGADVVELCYEFTNTGEIPLVVEDFSHGCGCIQGAWNGVPVMPGARGKITAKLLTKGLRGTVRKSVHVKFVEGGTVELIGEVKIPEALTYSTQFLSWRIGETPTSKQVDIKVTSQAPLRVLSVTGNDPAFSCELQGTVDARGYRVVIKPRDTDSERVCIVQVRTDSKDPRDALHGLFAVVEKPRQKGVGP